MKAHRWNPLITGLVAVGLMLVAVVGIVVSGIPGGPSLSLPWNSTMTLQADLTDADGLAPHAAVQIAGVKVGEVQTVKSDGNLSVVTMSVQSKYADIHRDARVLLRPHGLFGPKYVDLQPGSAAQAVLKSGDTIASSHAVQPVDLDQILHELQAPERERLRTALVEFGKAAASRGQDTRELISAGNTMSASLDSFATSLDTVNPQLNDFIIKDESFNSSFSQAPLDQLVANSNITDAAFARNAAHLESLLVHADSSLTQLDQALNGQSGNIRALLEVLPGTVDKLNRFNDLIGLFSANLTGKEPGEVDVTNGIIAAIENPKSAFSSYDKCTPGQPDAEGNVCPADGQEHYLNVQTFQQSAQATQSPFGPFGLPCSVLGVQLPTLGGCQNTQGSAGAQSHATLTSSSDLGAFVGLLGP